MLAELRKTARNFIFRFNLGDNVRRNMSRHRVGPGLKTEYETAEFTMAMLKNEDRLYSRDFLEDVLYMHHQWATSVLKVDKMYGAEMAGSW